MFTLVKIRLYQIKYELQHLGIAHCLFLLALFVGFEILLQMLFSKYPLWTTLDVLTFVLVQHWGRKDAIFVKMNVKNPQIALFFDYLIWIAPFIVVALSTTYWYCFFVILLGIIPISCLATKPAIPSLKLRFLARYIPVSSFEALSGVRKNYAIIALVVIYFAALSFSSVRGVPLFLLWLITISMGAFFNEYEPLNMLRKDEKLNGRRFIQKKLKRYIVPLLFFFTPILLVNALFHPDLWWVSVLFLLLQILSLNLSILYKYASYRPKAYFNKSSPVLIIAGLSIVLPFLMPLIVFFNIKYYPKAIKNLNYYLST
jgi:hypothetical protein